MNAMSEQKRGTHITHCCVRHGCAYGNSDCPVFAGEDLQQYACENCGYDEEATPGLPRVMPLVTSEYFKNASPEERRMLAGYNPSLYPIITVTVDAAIFTYAFGPADEEGLRHRVDYVLMVKRANYPYKGCWALPGGFIETDEDANAAIRREVAEETGLTDVRVFWQCFTFTTPGRDPRGRVFSILHWSRTAKPGYKSYEDLPAVTGGDDAAEAHWFPVSEISSMNARGEIAFDHEMMIATAYEDWEESVNR